MYTFWLVIVDLFWFALGRSGEESPVLIKTLPPRPETKYLEAVTTVRSSIPEISPTPPVSAPSIIQAEASAPLHAPVLMYVGNTAGSPRLIAPQTEFDGVMEVVPYGTAVTVVGYRGRYASVLRAGHTGWMLKDDLFSDKYQVWPQFIFKAVYLATDSDSLKIRAIISDQFNAGALGLPLQAGEYITIRLLDDHRTIFWPLVRPRLPGDWQVQLRGVSGIHSTITPKTDSIMEWRTEYDEGRLAYVEAVSPENTITISLVGLHDAGQYLTQVLTEPEWRELRPVFIQVA